jgi:hypothetical protein
MNRDETFDETIPSNEETPLLAHSAHEKWGTQLQETDETDSLSDFCTRAGEAVQLVRHTSTGILASF